MAKQTWHDDFTSSDAYPLLNAVQVVFYILIHNPLLNAFNGNFICIQIGICMRVLFNLNAMKRSPCKRVNFHPLSAVIRGNTNAIKKQSI